MMMSPEAYIEFEINGKSKDEILSKIRGLKNEIGHQKKILEEGDSEEIIAPHPLVQIKCMREYLAGAIECLKETGGEYTYSESERRVMDFNDRVDDIESVTLSYGGFFGGTEERKVFFDGQEIKIERRFFNGAGDLGEILFADTTKDEFLEIFKELYIGEWKKRYVDPDVLDGTQWELTICYTDGKTKRYYGSNMYPYNFDELLDLMEMGDYNR